MAAPPVDGVPQSLVEIVARLPADFARQPVRDRRQARRISGRRRPRTELEPLRAAGEA